MGEGEDREMVAAGQLREALKRQYHAGFAMLEETIENCPDEVWTSNSHRNAFWQIAYHVLFFTHLYLQTEEAAFVPWDQHQSDVQHADGITGPPDPNSSLPLIPQPYTRAQVLEYCRHCDAMVEGAVDALDLNSPTSGFYWYRMPKLEHQMVNLRHLQHHTAQLADRLRAEIGVGTRWVQSRRAKEEAG